MPIRRGFDPLPSPIVSILAVAYARWGYYLARLGIGGLFVYAGAAKLTAVKEFAALVARYGLVPEPLLPLVAVGLPLLEVVAGLGVLLGWQVAYRLTLGLMGLFLSVLWFGILRDLEIDCGCFSAAEQLEHGSLRRAFYRDWGLLVVVVYLLSWKKCNARWGPSVEVSRNGKGEVRG